MSKTKIFNLVFLIIFMNLELTKIASADNSTNNLIDNNLTLKQNFFSKIAVIDIQQIMNKSSAISEIKKTVDLISQNIQETMSETELKLKKLEEKLIKKRDILNEKEFNAEVKNFHQAVSLAKNDVQFKKTNLENAYQIAMNKINQKIKDIIFVLSAKYKFNLALPSSVPLFFQNELEITDEVLDILNRELSNVTIEYKN